MREGERGGREGDVEEEESGEGRKREITSASSIMSSIIESASHTNFLVRVAALHALSSEYTSLAHNQVGIKNMKIAMKNFLEQYQHSCPDAYIAFMATAYGSNK